MSRMESLQTTETPYTPSRTTLWAQLQVSDGLLLLIITAGAIMRLFRLDALPLNEGEAELAWAVWRYWQPGTAALPISSPAYFTLTGLLGQIGGFSDTMMRLIPAMAGIALLGVPWLLRRRLGNLGTLTMTLLLATSPLLTIAARTASGSAPALFALALLAAAILRYLEEREERWLIVGSAAAGLGMAAAPVFYTGMVAFAAAALLQRRIGLPLPGIPAAVDADTESEQAWRPPRRAVITLLVVFVGVSTLFLRYPAGLGQSIGMLGQWAAAFAGGAERTVLDPLLLVGRYEIGLLILGVPLLIWGIFSGRSHSLLAFYTIAPLLLLLILQRGTMENGLLFMLPGSLLIADYIQAQARHLNRLTWAVAGLFFLGIGLLALNFARYTRIAATNSDDVAIVLVIFLAITAVGLALYFLATWDPALTLRGLVLAILAAMLYFSWGTAWWLAQEGANDPRARWAAAGSDESVRIMQEMLLDIANQARNSSRELEIFSAVDSDVLRWYLRPFSELEMGNAVPAQTEHEVVITPISFNSPLAATYVGGDFQGADDGGTAVRNAQPDPVYGHLALVALP
jgi:hypothetical protein